MKQNIANGHAMSAKSDGVTELHSDNLFQDDQNLFDYIQVEDDNSDRVKEFQNYSSLQKNGETYQHPSRFLRLRFETCSTALRLLFDYASTVVRLRFDCCSAALRLVFGYASTNSRIRPEGLPNDSASNPEQVSTNLAIERHVKCETTSLDFDRRTPSISDKECTVNVPLVYGGCTGGVLKRYQEGTEEVLKKYQKGTKHLRALGTSLVARLWLASRSGVGASYRKCTAVIVIVLVFHLMIDFQKVMKIKSTLFFVCGFSFCFSLFNDALAQSRDSLGTAAGVQTEKIASLLSPKKEFILQYDLQAPLGSGGNGLTMNSTLMHSMLLRYQDGMSSQIVHATPAYSDGRFNLKHDAYRIGCYNCPLIDLYRLAHYDEKYMYDHNRILVEVDDPRRIVNNTDRGEKYVEWLRQDNGFTYEGVISFDFDKKMLYSRMSRDLSEYFPQYEVQIEPREVECLLLKRTDDTDRLASQGQEATVDYSLFGFTMTNLYGISYFVERLHFYLQNEPPVVDLTGYEGKIDIAIKAKIHDVDDLNRALEVYGLKLERGLHTIDMMVIRDSDHLNKKEVQK